ncbi:penicillin-binding protein [Sporosarcina sp. NPDC096371]|uniref:penicillin-binding protein n=1 Tax=Sporosarcina sp. NPDC096371 TaxID=3364530 RepID=UPI003824CF91
MLFIQVTGQAEGRAMAALAEAKYARESVLKAERGTIVDRNGALIAADTLSYKMIVILDKKASKGSKTPRHVKKANYDATAEVLSKHIPLEKADILARITDYASRGKYQLELGKAGRDISHETVLAIREELKEKELSGIQFLEDQKRFYPNGVFASYLVGFAMREEDEDGNLTTVGKMGLEKTYDKELTGTDGKMNFRSDGWGFKLPKADEVVTPAQDGHDIQLTIDKTIQSFVEDAMTRVESEYSPKKMLVVVANPKTGEILAMSQRPSFHPATREGLTENWLNEALETTIEPGSTMKMFTLAAAIEEKKWDPNAWFQSGQYKIFDRIIGDVNNRKGWGTITYLEGFQRSSNVAMAYLLERLGDKTFIEYIRKFGFGEKTGIDLPNEAPGVILDTYPSERLTTSYGQGSTVTAMQMIQAATAIANNGVMMKPYVIDKITNPNTDEVVKNQQPEEHDSPISAATAKEVREVLASTITGEHGSGKKFALNGYTVAGKTGTAEIPGPNGRYLKGGSNYLYSFLGMAPVEDPQLITYVFVQQPELKEGKHGSIPVAELFTSIMENSLRYMNILPNGEDVVEATVVRETVDKDSTEVIAQLKKDGFDPVIVGEGGRIERQYPSAGTKLTEGSVVLLQTAGATTLPDFTGWSKKMVLSFKMLSGLDIRINGDGYVTEQSLSKGTVIEPNEPVVVQLKSPVDIYKPEKEIPEEESIVGG